MNERFYYGSDRHDEVNEAPRRFRSEAGAAGRLNRIFGGEREPRVSDPGIPTRPVDSAQPGGVVIYSPSTYEEVQLLIDHLKRREQVIVDFSDINQSIVYRILDFMSGAIYALSGSVQQITKNIFLFAPSGVTISVPPQLGRR